MTEERSAEEENLSVLLEVMKHPLRNRVLLAVAERPGVTVKQIAERLGVPVRGVRHQIGWLVDAGLIEVDGSTPRRNARENHYRVVKVVRVDSWADLPTTSEERRRIALGIVGILLDDVRRAMDSKTIGTHKRGSYIRIPGEIDQIGWKELDRIVSLATKQVEEVMRRSARRLADAGQEGSEVILALLLMEAQPWRLNDERGGRSGSSLWLEPPADGG